MKFATDTQAIEHGTATGESDGETLYNENHESYRSESDAVSGLYDCASEAASVLGVPREHYSAWIAAYAAAAEEVIRRLYTCGERLSALSTE